jgi:hypothetical protein
MDKSFYQRVREAGDSHDNFSSVLGEGTEYEAIARVAVHDGDWYGYIVFKDTRFSPVDKDNPGIQLKYMTPGAANGVVAHYRANEFWQNVVEVFEGIRPKASPPPGSCVDETSVLK